MTRLFPFIHTLFCGLGAFLISSPAFGAGSIGDVVVSVATSPDPLPAGWRYELRYQDVNGSWYFFVYGDETDSFFKQDPTWANKSIRWRCQLLNNYVPYGAPQEKINYGGSDALAFSISVPQIPAAPTGVSSTDGSYPDRIVVTWNHVTGASGYEVWRASSSSVGSASKIADTSSASYSDNSVASGNVYYYWVKAVAASGSSGYGGPDSGYTSIDLPQPPGGVSASDGSFADRVVVSWASVSGATEYEVWRNTTVDSSSAGLLARSASTTYQDQTVANNVVYYYWIKARNAGGASSFSASDSGYREIVPPLAPADIEASDGVWSNNVRVSWSESSGASGYTIWRSPDNDFGSSIQVGSSERSVFDVFEAAGATNYYWVRAFNSAGASGFGGPDTGYSSPSAPGWLASPTGVTASDRSYSNKIVLVWVSVPGADGYEIWRSTSSDLGAASSIALVSGGVYEDYHSPGSVYFYWVKATNSSSVSAFSDFDEGSTARSLPYVAVLTSAEYFIDDDPGEGNATPIASSDYFFDESVEEVLNGYIDTSALEAGHHRVGARISQSGVWGKPVFADFYVYDDGEPESVSQRRLIYSEYYLDNDYGYEQNYRPFVQDGLLDSGIEGVSEEALRSSNLVPGEHRIGLRFKDELGHWSRTREEIVFVFADSVPVAPPVHDIAEAEYYYGEKPSGGAGFPLAISNLHPIAGIADGAKTNITTAGLPVGWNKLGVRFKNTAGRWGGPIWHLLEVAKEDFPITNVNLHVESNIGVPSYNLDSVQRRGDLIELRVPETIDYEGATYFNMGWVGTGDAPPAGTSNQVSFVIEKDSTVTWIWSESRMVSVALSNDFGQGRGDGSYLRFSAVTASVPQYVYSGSNVRWRVTNFVGTGSAPYSMGVYTQVVFSPSADSSITWQWVKQYRVDTVSENGIIYNNWKWYDEGQSTELDPVAYDGYEFGGWTGDGGGTNAPGVFPVNGAMVIGAIFDPRPSSEAIILITEIDGSITSRTATVGEKVTLQPVVDMVVEGERRDVVSSWILNDDDAITFGEGTNLHLVVSGDLELTWVPTRQHYVAPRAIPANGGRIRISANQVRSDTNWYDAGVFKAVASPNSGYRFAGWYLKDSEHPEVEAVLDERTQLIAMFRREKPLVGFAQVSGGTLTSPNNSAYGFSGFIPSFLLSQKEVTADQFSQFLNEALECGTIHYPDRLSIRGQNPLAEYVQGLRVDYYLGDNLAAEALERNRASSLEFNFTNGSPASSTFGIPVSTVSDQDNFAMRFMGEVYVPLTGPIRFQEMSDDAAALYVDGQLVYSDTNSIYDASGVMQLTQGWHSIEVAYIEYLGNARMAVRWDTAGGTEFVSIPSNSLRCRLTSSKSESLIDDSGAFSYYPYQELYDLDSPFANIELTNGLYRPKSGLERHPVVEVTWYGAMAYCEWLSGCTGEEVDLPSEWMWEYAASKGNSTIGGNYFPWGPKFAGANRSQANYIGVGGDDIYEKTSPVGSFPLYNNMYDMAGNVWEWTTSSQANGSEFRVIRGGSWNQTPDPYLSTSYRLAYKSEDYGDESTGFRPAVVHEVDFSQEGYVLVPADPSVDSANENFGGYVAPARPFFIKATELRNSEIIDFLNDCYLSGKSTVGGQVIYGNLSEWYDDKPWLNLAMSTGLTWSGSAFYVRRGYENYPVGGLSYYGASAFEKWTNEQDPYRNHGVIDEWQWEKAVLMGVPLSTIHYRNKRAVGQAGLEIAYDYSFWPGLYDISGNVQEWTSSRPDSALQNYSVLRGGAWPIQPRAYEYRNDYAAQNEMRNYFGSRPAINHVQPQFRWAQPDLIMPQGGAAVTQLLDAVALFSDDPVNWLLATNTPSWISISDLGYGRAAVVLSPPLNSTSTTVDVMISDGIMSNIASFDVYVENNGILLSGVPDELSLSQGAGTRYIHPQASTASSNITLFWSLQVSEPWAVLTVDTSGVARVAIDTSVARSSNMTIIVSNGVHVASRTCHVVVENTDPRILSGPTFIDLKAVQSSQDFVFSGYDPDGFQELSWSVEGSPEWATFVAVSEGQSVMRVSRTSAAIDTNILVILSDGVATTTWTVAVVDLNSAPVIRTVPDTMMAAVGGPSVSASLFATDPDILDTLTWSGSPESTLTETIDRLDGTGVLRIWPGNSLTSFNYMVEVSDGSVSTGSSVTVVITNNLPEFVGDIGSNAFARNSGTYDLYVTAIDPDKHQQVDMTVSNVPPWITAVRVAPNAYKFLVSTLDSGSSIIMLSASDGFATNSTPLAVTVNSSDDNDLPVLAGFPTNVSMKLWGPTQTYRLTIKDLDTNDWMSWLVVNPNPNISLRLIDNRSADLICAGVQETGPTNILLVITDGKASRRYTTTLFVGPKSLDNHLIVGGEYFFNVAPTNGGGVPLLASEAKAMGDSLEYSVPIRVSDTLTNGHYRIGVRLITKGGSWSSPVWTDLYVYEDIERDLDIVKPILVNARSALGEGMQDGSVREMGPHDAYDSSLEATAEEQYDSAPLSPGVYRLKASFLDSKGNWATNAPRTLIVYDDKPVEAPPSKDVIAAEYFWDTAPSPGFGFAVDLLPETNGFGDIARINDISIPTGSLIPGTHRLGVRMQDEYKVWGNPIYYTIQVDIETQALNLVNLHTESNIGDPELEYDSQHPSNTLLRLAVPEIYSYNNSDYAISGWIGVGDVPGYGDSNRVTFTLRQASDLTWIWVQDVEVYSFSDYGAVSGNGNWTWYPDFKTGFGTYKVRSNVTLSVTSPVAVSTGEQLVAIGYSGNGSAPEVGYTTEVSFPALTWQTEVTWNWERQYALTTNVVGRGRVFGNHGWYGTGVVAVITAVPDSGNDFLYWEGDVSGTNPSVTVTMTAPRTVTAVFSGAVPSWDLYAIDPISTQLIYEGRYDNGQVVTSTYRHISHLDAGSRYVVTGWYGKGSAPALGDTNYASFVIETNTIVEWNGIRQHYVSLESVPSSLGAVLAYGESSAAGSNWFDEGLIFITNMPAPGAHLLSYSRDLAGAPHGVWRNHNKPLAVAGLFRSNRVDNSFVPVVGGLLQSPNSEVPGFTPLIEAFELKQTEVSVGEYGEFLNESLFYRTAEFKGAGSVVGRQPARDYAVGFDAAIIEGGTTSAPVSSFSRWLETRIDKDVFSSAESFSPPLEPELSNGLSVVVNGDIYVPTDEDVAFKITSNSGVSSMSVGGALLLNSVSGNTTVTSSPGYGWHRFAYSFESSSTNPTVSIEWAYDTNGYHTIGAEYSRHESRYGGALIKLAAAKIGILSSVEADFTANQAAVKPGDGYDFVFGLIPQDCLLASAVSRPASGFAGLMMRTANDWSSSYVAIGVNSSGLVVCKYRQHAGGPESMRTVSTINAKDVHEIMITRIGSRFKCGVKVGEIYLDVFTETTEERWIEIGDVLTGTLMGGFHSSTSSGYFYDYRFIVPAERNYFDGLELVDMDAFKSPFAMNSSGNGATNRTDLSHPAVEVTWAGAKNYARWLEEGAMSGEYDLPSEWQVEYASSGGISLDPDGQYPWPSGDIAGDYGNYADTSGADIYSGLAPVGALSPYRGFYDLGGNVWEWTDSLYWPDGVWRSVRGAAWDQESEVAKTSNREYYVLPYFSNDSTGFRVARRGTPGNNYSRISGGESLDGPDYFIMATEVTAIEYTQFLNHAQTNGWIVIQDNNVIGDGIYPGKLIMTLTGHPFIGWDSSTTNYYCAPSFEQRPAILVSWYGAKAYAAYIQLGDPEYTYDLPTENEWEKAAQQGVEWDYKWTSPVNGDDISLKYLSSLHDVGLLAPFTTFAAASVYGLYDIHGNAAEWTLGQPLNVDDSYIIRGLSVGYPVSMQQISYRGYYKNPQFTDPYVGFRLVARPDSLRLSVPSTSMAFKAYSGVFEIIVGCNNPRGVDQLNWILDNAPNGITLISDGSSIARLIINTYADFVSSNLNIIVSDSASTAHAAISVDQLVALPSIRVNIGPSEVVEQGAAWRIVGTGDTNWLMSGFVMSNLVSSQDYTVEFKPVMYWITPDNHVESLASASTSLVYVSYLPEVTTIGTPLYWLARYGLALDDSGDNDDSDFDGQSNWKEFLAGTSPTNDQSLLWMPVVRTVGSNKMVLTWTSESNKMYNIEASEGLMDEFTPYVSDILASPPMNTYTTQVDGFNAKYFRIQLK